MASKTPGIKASAAKDPYDTNTVLALAAREYAIESRKQNESSRFFMLIILCFVFCMFAYNLFTLGFHFGDFSLKNGTNISQNAGGIELLWAMPMNVLFLTLIGLLSRLVAFHISASKEWQAKSLEIYTLDRARTYLASPRREDVIVGYFSKNDE